MNVTIKPSVLCGALPAIPSKSHAHRLIICASLSDTPCSVICKTTSRDIEATVECMRALGAEIERTDTGYYIVPISLGQKKSKATLDCAESGSTLRFLLPVCAALGISVDFVLHARLADRPLSPLYEILTEGGAVLSDKGSNPLALRGSLAPRDFSIAGDVSSQFISGLLFACPLFEGGGSVTLTTKAQSSGYIDMTVDCLRAFGVSVDERECDGKTSFTVSGSYKTPRTALEAEGDWSNAAFLLCAGAIGSAPVAVSGLNENSLQPDRAIIDILRKFGAEIEISADKFVVSPASLRGCEIDVSQTPDLAPVISVVAACAEGKTRIFGASRLRFKESDRIKSITDMIRSLGGEAQDDNDEITVHGTGISGGVTDSHNDHRIAMAAAIASAASAEDITVLGAQAVEKSYPSFFEDLEKIRIV